MATVTFDTLKFVEKLKAAGFPEAQAKALVEAHAEAFSEIAEGQLATKADSVRIERRIDTVEASLKQEIADVKADVRPL